MISWMGMRGMDSRRGYSSFPTTFLIFSLLLLVLAGGFAVGRLVVGRAYVKSAGQFEKWPGPKAEEATAAPAEGELPSGQGYVPAPSRQAAESQSPGKPEAAPGEQTEQAKPEAPAAASAPAPSPAPQALPAPAESPQPAEEKERRYAIQVGVFEGEEGAQKVADDLARAGYPAQVESTRGEQGNVYRVLTGRYRTEYAARKAMDQLRQEGFSGFLVER